MKHRKIVPAVLLALTLALVLAACGAPGTQASPTPSAPQTDGQESGEPGGGHYPVTITTYNYAGQPVETVYESAPERVICVYQGCIETMIALGLEDHVLASYGLDNQVKEEWQEGFENMHYDDSVFAPDKETVTVLQPDMIFSWGSYFSDTKLGDVSEWIGGGVNTYMNTNTVPGGSRTLENEYADILNIGRIFDGEDRAEALVRPGVRLCDVDAAARDHIAAAGYGDYFTHRLGHFIGMEDHEKGDVSQMNPKPAQAGMVFSIEPGIYLPGRMGVRIEDLVIVTEDGCEILNQVEKGLRVLGV